MLHADPSLQPQDITRILQATAVDIPDRRLRDGSLQAIGQGTDADSGAGLIDAHAAVAAVLNRADLTLAMAADPAAVAAGGRVTYTITATNHGPGRATGVVVENVLPAGLAPVSTSGCHEDPAGVPNCSLGEIASGGSAVYHLVAEVGSGVTGALASTAQVHAVQDDPRPGNNSTSATVQAVAPAADLAITVNGPPDGAVGSGGHIRYFVQVRNNGPDGATGVVATGAFPDLLSQASTSGCAEDPAGVPACSLGNIPPGEERQYTMEAVIAPDAWGTLHYSAQVAAGTADPQSSNNSAHASMWLIGQLMLRISYTGSGAGRVATETGAECDQGCGPYPGLTEVVLTATAASGHRFAGWDGDCAGLSGTRVTVLMDSQKQCTARFERLPVLTVLHSGDGRGSVISNPGPISCNNAGLTVNVCTAPFNPGTRVSLSAHPGAGSVFDHWSGDPGCETGSPVLDTDKTCTAHFARQDAMALTGMLNGGYRHSIALSEDGTVWTFGRNDSGELGDGTTASRAVPRPQTSLPPVRQITANNGHSGALDREGRVWLWGSNQDSDLGLSGGGYYSTPFQVEGLPKIVQFATGYYTHAALAEDGSVWTWGPDWFGQMGDGQPGGVSAVPKQVEGLTEVVAVASGGHHNLALRADGTVWAWGRNNAGQLGDGTTNDRSRPVRVAGLENVVLVAAGAGYSMAASTDGTLWAWGSNTDGQLGNGDFTEQHAPVRVQIPPKYRGIIGGRTVRAIAAGAYHAAALFGDGTVLAWGRGIEGQLGNGAWNTSPTPVRVATIDDATGIGAGSFHLLVQRRNGSVWAWGLDAQGEVGDGETNRRYNQPRASSGLSLKVAPPVLAGGRHSLAVRADGSVWSWGENEQGELGDGGTTDRSVPARIDGVPAARMVFAANTHSATLDRSGRLWQWGGNEYGELGTGETGNNYPTPFLAAGLPVLRTASVGSFTNAGVDEFGRVWTWGPDWYGAMGDSQPGGTGHPPARIESLANIATVASGAQHNLALAADGTVWAWGRNSHGQVGDGTTEHRSVPVRIAGLAGVVALAAYNDVSIALGADGSVWAWGDNAQGQLGDGTTEDRLVPTRVIGLPGRVVAIDCGSPFATALLADGRVYTWGQGQDGVLGQGGYQASPTPAQVTGLGPVAAIGSGTLHTLVALRDGSAVSAWGSDTHGQLGDGSPSHSHATPVASSGFTLGD